MKKREINTFSDPESDKYAIQRAENTLQFINENVHPIGPFALDVAGPSPVGKYISSALGLKYKTTEGDLDYDPFLLDGVIPSFVLCLEIIEHLMSPKYFLKTLAENTTASIDLIITYPSRPKFLWTSCHFHEYDKKRFEYLVEQSGWKIVARDRKRIPKPFWKYFTGIRTPLRLIYDMDSMFHLRKTIKAGGTNE